MNVEELASIGVEGCASLLLCVIAYKIYRMKVSTHSGCCGDKFIVDTQNAGHSNNEPSLMNQV